MSSAIEPTFSELVSLDLETNISDEQLAILKSDLFGWKDELQFRVQEIDSELANIQKAAYLEKRLPDGRVITVAKKPKERAPLVKAKTIAIDRLRDVKALIRETHLSISGDGKEPMAPILKEILAELRALRKDLAPHL